MSDFSKMPFNWAGEEALTEAEAFEWAVKSSKIKKNDNEYQRGFDDGYKIGLEEAQQATLEKFNGIIQENTDLRKELKVLSDMNTRMREALLHSSETDYD